MFLSKLLFAKEKHIQGILTNTVNFWNSPFVLGPVCAMLAILVLMIVRKVYNIENILVHQKGSSNVAPDTFSLRESKKMEEEIVNNIE